MTAAPPRGGSPGAPHLAGLVYVQPLGSGGHADVYLYEQQSPRMPVAVKVLRAEGMTDALRRQFLAEADTMAQLGDHPYIVQVFRADTSDDGRPFLVMKYYPPPDLATRARAQALSVEDVLRTGIQLASAIETAHRAGIVHRDIKPANVLVSPYGAPGLADFGIAGRGSTQPGVPQPGATQSDVTQSDVTQSEVTGPGDVGVSVPWAPPEVLYAQSDGSPAADIYSLAATLWHLLAGRSPFEVPGGDNSAYALMPRIRTLPVPVTGRADVPASLERILAQAMAKDPGVRPASAIELARALQSVEQELRLARTPVVVLDGTGRTQLLGQPGQVDQPPVIPEAGDPDATRVKSPLPVAAQQPLPGGPSPSGPPFPGAALPPPPAAGPARPEPAEPAGPRHRWASLLVAATVVAVALVGYLVLRPRDQGQPASTRTPVATLSTTQDSAIGDGVFVAPAVTAVAKVAAVELSWSYPNPKQSDRYRIHVGENPEAAQVADPVTLEVATYTVKVASGAPACIVVSVVRDGQISPASKPVCATAR